jgi:regulator of RNase E activity RraA
MPLTQEPHVSLEEFARRLALLDTACVCDADPTVRALDPAIRPVGAAARLIGSAFPVACDEDFLPVLLALRDAEPGDVLVVAAGGSPRAVAGELFTTEAARKGLAGIVVDGAVRDALGIGATGLPVYARHLHPRAGGTAQLTPPTGQVTCGGVPVRRGELVFGDADGVVVLAPDDLERVVGAAEAIQRAEAALLERMAAGDSLFDHLNLDEHAERLARGDTGTRLRFR